MNKLVKAMIKNLLKDIGSDRYLNHLEALDFLNDNEMVDLIIQAGCPESIIEAMKETLPLSRVERIHCCDKIWSEIKKIPIKGGLDRD